MSFYAQVPSPTPEAPPFIKELVGELTPLWITFLVVGVIAAAVGAGVAARHSDLSIGMTRIPMGLLASAGAAIAAFSLFLLVWGN
ncbi:hypothetical protein JOE30_000310 [Rhodococcus sp. PvP016]|uniref:Uncharacterized protein n=1 Tax=Rhodococcoides corynebacterioides TaxID=53972 RepID=A0ABS2KWD5_9NOCA|nr:hypothetical protein [Rhodococcus corynebacterioides]MBP1114513.1 hypothetical protein [Rhodococcus sp. PvP016]